MGKVGRKRLVQVAEESGMEIYTMLAVPVEALYLVAWNIIKALLIELRLEILLVSLVCFNNSLGFKVMMMILIKRAKMAMTIRSSIKVNDLVFSFNLRNEGMG